jgi:L-rhamnose mutarotase
MKRYASIIGVLPEKLEEYKKLHAVVWPEVLSTIKACNINNYSIFYKDGMLYSYFEYLGEDYDQDMKKMADDPVTQDWWKLCSPCQAPVKTRKENEWWATMEELFHLD